MTIAGYTYVELQEEVLAHQFSPTKYRPLVKTWLNQAQRRAVIESEMRTEEDDEPYATVRGQKSYSLPADFNRLMNLHCVEPPELLAPVDPTEFDVLPASEGRPYAYTAIGTSIYLYPTPDGVYSLDLRYWRLPKDMVADTDTPEIAVQYHEMLIAYAMAKAFRREDDFTAAAEWQKVWEAGITKMRGEVQHDMFDGPRQVPGAWGDPHGAPLIGTWR